MLEQVRVFIEKLKAQRFGALDEAAARQGIVLPLLSQLGWDVFNVDEVVPEYPVGDTRVDYALRLDNTSKVFIEVKKPTENLERHQEQLLGYSFKQGIKLATLTNGVTWWLYLPLHEGSWSERKFYTVDVLEQEPPEATAKFCEFLSKEAVASGKAVESAEGVYKSQQRTKTVQQTLPRAWAKIVSEPDEALVDLLSETTEKLCGHRAEADDVEAFLAQVRHTAAPISVPPPLAPQPIPPRPLISGPSPNYSGKSPRGFVFLGQKCEVGTWKDLLIRFCAMLAQRHSADLERVLSLRGRKRQYFARSPDTLYSPRGIGESGIYVETNMSANSIVDLCRRLLTLFGYGESDLSIEAS